LKLKFKLLSSLLQPFLKNYLWNKWKWSFISFRNPFYRYLVSKTLICGFSKYWKGLSVGNHIIFLFDQADYKCL